MSDNDPFNEGNDGGIGSLRKQYKKLLEQNKEMAEQLAAIQSSHNANQIDQILRLRGVNPAVAKFYPQGRATTAEAVEEWIEENRDLFGVPTEAPGPVASSLSPIEQEGYEIVRKIQAAEAATQADFEAKLAAAGSQEEVLALMKEFGQQHTF